ncbi:hypothetical protein SY85_20625 [Flavisolibacter tropicus]|uniref:Uncharacterized protein n=1 Tax=Flavisolibacter tropicus TaxID=1492898 RepID=A0A172TZU7_9BACT|nr:hypothetical protein SY85_20625 [Flavisolibacter tropicus]
MRREALPSLPEGEESKCTKPEEQIHFNTKAPRLWSAFLYWKAKSFTSERRLFEPGFGEIQGLKESWAVFCIFSVFFLRRFQPFELHFFLLLLLCL